MDVSQLDLTPNYSSEAKDFFQSDKDLAIQAAREEKRRRLIQESTVHSKSNPHSIPTITSVSSKVLALILVENTKTNSQAKDDESATFAYVGESGHIARRFNLSVNISSFVSCYLIFFF